MKPNINDDITESGCPFVGEEYSYNYYNPDVYTSVINDFLDKLRIPMSKAFNLSPYKTKYMNFTDLYDYSDILLGETMEGTCPSRYNFTQEEWYYTRLVQLYTLVLDMDDYARSLFITK